MANQFIGYVASFVVVVSVAGGLQRWFTWRRSLRRRLLDVTGDAGHV